MTMTKIMNQPSKVSNTVILVALAVVLVTTPVASQWTNSSSCDAAEARGIEQCQSAGDGFTLDRSKYESCPQREGDAEHNTADWTCDEWKCHIYCSNPVRSDARKECTNCDEVEVGEGCWDERRRECEAAKLDLDGCDVQCGGAAALRRLPSFARAALATLGLTIIPLTF